MSRDRIELRPGSLPIEPLPDLSWQRIERKLFAQLATGTPRSTAPLERPRPSRRSWLVAAGAVGAAAAAVVLGLALRGDQALEDRRDDDSGRTPSRIATQDAPSALSVGGVSLEIAPRSALLVDQDPDRGVLIVLERGEATFRVAPVGSRPPVVVHAGDLRIEVIGTAFSVSREGDSARVVVYEGVVSLVHRGERLRLAAGGIWPTAPDPGADEPSEEPEQAEPPPSPAGGQRGRKPHTDKKSRQPALEAPRASEKDRYQAAQKLEGSDPGAALTIYAELSRRGGVYAPMALYAQALLQLRLQHNDVARKLLKQYLRLYPDGLNAIDARELLEETGTK